LGGALFAPRPHYAPTQPDYGGRGSTINRLLRARLYNIRLCF
jgi:hypothetical protein